MQVSTRIFYPDVGFGRSRASTQRPWTADRVPPVRADEQGSGYRGTLARGSHQQVNDRPGGGTGDKEVFVARSLSSTLAMLQMHVVPTADEDAASAASAGDETTSVSSGSFVDDLFSGVLAPRGTQ